MSKTDSEPNTRACCTRIRVTGPLDGAILCEFIITDPTGVEDNVRVIRDFNAYEVQVVRRVTTTGDILTRQWFCAEWVHNPHCPHSSHINLHRRRDTFGSSPTHPVSFFKKTLDAAERVILADSFFRFR